jgi:hypothetical protein
MSLYTDRIAQGLCGVAGCDQKPIKGKMCPKHKKEQADRTAARRAAQKATGHCLYSGCTATEDLRGGWCSVHRAVKAASRKRGIQRRKDAGLCATSAAHGKAKDGCTLCQACIDKLTANAAAWQQANLAAGFCRYGKHPALPGEQMCQAHKDQCTAATTN